MSAGPALHATTTIDATDATDGWEPVGDLGAWLPWTGRAVLTSDGRQLAVFRLGDDDVAAIDNRDPFTQANVLARGIVGNEGGVVKVASPLLKHRFDLRTGACLDDPDMAVAAHEARVVDGVVEVRPARRPTDITEAQTADQTAGKTATRPAPVTEELP